MEPDFTKEEKKLFKAKDPEDYIKKSLKCDISPGRKAFVTRHWLKSTGYKFSELEYYRNRHPYWKAKKMEGTAERNVIRSNKHNYGDGSKKFWDQELIKKFIEMNKKDKTDKYIHKDWELAKQFECTIATIQHMRRKFNMAIKIIALKSEKVTNKKILDYLQMGEGSLRNIVKELNSKK